MSKRGVGWIFAGMAVLAVCFFLRDSNWYYAAIPDQLWQLDGVFHAFFREGFGYATGALMMIWGGYRFVSRRGG